MATYVDGFVFSVPKAKKTAYKKMAREGKATWMKFGALDYKECRANDMKASHVKFTFPKMAKTKPSEEVWFSFIVFKSKKDRDIVNKKVMAHFSKKYKNSKKAPDMPFDMKRMAYGGFVTEVE